jgi:hypothetical protein
MSKRKSLDMNRIKYSSTKSPSIDNGFFFWNLKETRYIFVI